MEDAERSVVVSKPRNIEEIQECSESMIDRISE
jgi:hypothetical protein